MGGTQKSSVSARILRSAKTVRAPASESLSRLPPSPLSPVRAGRFRVPKRSRAAEERKVTTVIAIASRAETTVSSTPPAPKPISSALCETIRSSERPST